MAQLRFFKQGTAPTGERLVAGSIWFNTSNKTIEVYTGSAWEQYAGKLTNAEWNTQDQILTISKADGSSITLDFSNIASLSGVQAALTALENKLTPLITAAQTAADAAQSHSEGVAADLAQEVTDRTNADNALDGRLTTVEGKVNSLASATHFLGVKNSLDEVTAPAAGDIVIVGNKEYVYDEEKGWVELGDTTDETQRIAALETKVGDDTVANQITAKIADLDAEVTSTGGSKVSIDVTEVDGKVTGVTVTETDIASAAALTEAESNIATNKANIAELQTKVDVAKVSTAITEAVEALDSEKTSDNGVHVNVTVKEVDGKLESVSVSESDIASATELATAQGDITDLKSRMDTVEAGLEWEEFA